MNCLGLLWDAGSLFGAKHYEPHLFAEENAAPVVFDVTCEDCLRVYSVHVDFQTQEALDEFNYRRKRLAAVDRRIQEIVEMKKVLAEEGDEDG